MKVIIKMAITVDGKIAQKPDQPATWTSREDKKNFIAETKEAGVIIMGLKTYETLGKPLKDRLNIVLAFNASEHKNIPNQLEFTSDAPEKILENLKNRGFKKVIIGGGMMVNSLFLEKKLVDEIHLTVEPLIFGKGLSLCDNLTETNDLELISIEKLNNNTLLLKYNFKK